MRKTKGLSFYVLLGFVIFFASSTLSAVDLADGYYVKINGGSVTQDSYQKMVVTPNENCSMGSENLLEAYIYLPAGAEGFSIVKVSQGENKVFQPSANVKQVNNWLYYEPQPQTNFLRGQFEEGVSPFTITESGLFYVAIEINTRWMTCIPIKNWNILGTAITGGWEPSNLTLLSPTFSADKKSAVFAFE